MNCCFCPSCHSATCRGLKGVGGRRGIGGWGSVDRESSPQAAVWPAGRAEVAPARGRIGQGWRLSRDRGGASEGGASGSGGGVACKRVRAACNDGIEGTGGEGGEGV